MQKASPTFFVEELAGVIQECLAAGLPVEVDRLGVFRLTKEGLVDFIASTRPKVFISYASEDFESAQRLHAGLEREGFDAWLDRKRLLAGNNWPRSIENAIAITDFFLPIFSNNSTTKRGFFQAEIRHAMDCARLLPHDAAFVIPVRLDECFVPRVIEEQIHYIDLFPDWEEGIRRTSSALKAHWRLRRRNSAPAMAERT